MASSILQIAGASGAVWWGEEEDGHHTWGSLGMGSASSLHPDNLWQAGEALPALQIHPQLVQVTAQC